MNESGPASAPAGAGSHRADACVLAADLTPGALTVARWARGPAGLQLQAVQTWALRTPAAELPAGLRALAAGQAVLGVGVSVAGETDPAGARVTAGPAYLAPLQDAAYGTRLAAAAGGPVTLVNTAHAALIAAAERGQVFGPGSFGLLVVDDECSVAVWKNGRLWQPGRRPPAFSALQTSAGTFGELLGVAALSGAAEGGALRDALRGERFRSVQDAYLTQLAYGVANLARLYHLDTVLIAGRLAAAVMEAGFDLAGALALRQPPAADAEALPRVQVLDAGDRLALWGAAALAEGEARVRPARFRRSFADLPTETAARPGVRLETRAPAELIQLCLETEAAVAARWQDQTAALTLCAERLQAAWQRGGRLIYVGCGTSGRLAALDAVELNCTFGLPLEQALVLVSGGLAEAAFSVESNFEEDTSAVPEALLLNLTPADVVVGISASGTAYYVRSALALARSRGAWTVLLSVAPPADTAAFYDWHIALDTGPELVTGSTRLKAGTATKKILNAVSTTAMILAGKVAGTYMIDVACVNAKLVARAQTILAALYGLDRDEARRLLEAHQLSLAAVVRTLAAQKGSEA